MKRGCPAKSTDREGGAKRLLFIAHRMPYPPDNGARVRAYHEIVALSKHFHVTVAAIAHDAAEIESARALGAVCDRVVVAPAGGSRGLVRGGMAMVGGRSVTEGYFHSPRLRALLAAEARSGAFDLALGYCSSVLPYLLAVPARVRLIDLVDVDSAKWAGYAAAASRPMRWLYRRESAMVRRLEQRAIDACDAVALISEAEIRVLGARSEKVAAVGNGVDTDYFKPAETPAAAPASIVFTGTMDYRPNAEAVGWFASAVWPALRRRWPDLSFQIVGRRPTAAVRRLSEIPGIHVLGEVPDVRPYLAAARAAVCPLRIAHGIQNKILEAMAMGRPVVGTPVALEGLDVTVGHDVLQAETPEQFEQQITRLLEDAALGERLGASARRSIESRYTWPAQMEPLVALCERLVEQSDSRCLV